MSLCGHPIEFRPYRDKQMVRGLIQATHARQILPCLSRHHNCNDQPKFVNPPKPSCLHHGPLIPVLARMVRTKGSCSGVRGTAGAAVGKGEGEGTRVDEGMRGRGGVDVHGVMGSDVKEGAGVGVGRGVGTWAGWSFGRRSAISTRTRKMSPSRPP